MTSSRRILAIVVIASSVSTFDYAFGLSCIVEGRAGLIPIVTLVAALNRETAVLFPTALLIAAVDAKNRRRLISLAILSFVLWLATFASLRFFIGPAPAAITLHDI